MNDIGSKQERQVADLIVLSDLHLGEGMRRDEPRYVPTEDFFHDRQFANLIEDLKKRYQGRPSGLKLVLNGDTFDFITVVNTPRREDDPGFEVSQTERKFGLNPTEKKSVYKLDVTVRGHPLFFDALARFVAAGFCVEIIRGNHDLELFFPAVKARLIQHLAERGEHLDCDTVASRVRFHEWFYLEPGRVYIEHGQQYDAGNSIRYPFHPIRPVKKRAPDEEKILDYPLGSIFVRFFYNRVKQLDPYSPRLVSFDHYLSFIKRYNLFDVWKVYRDHYPHFIAALGTTNVVGSSKSSEEEDVRQSTIFENLSERRGGGHLLERLNALKISPVSASKANVVKEMVSAFFRRGLRFGILAFVAIFIWFGILQLIDLVPGVTANAFLMALFAVATLGGALTIWIHLDRKLRRRDTVSEPIKLIETAKKIADIADVKMVIMGHTHMVDYRRINDGKAVYANSGTWTSIDNPWSRFMRDARRLTFLHVKGDEVQLLRWNDDAYRFDTVPLFDLALAETMDQLPSVTALDVAATGRKSLPPSPAYVQDEDDFEDAEPS
jgi:hypothetical protein